MQFIIVAFCVSGAVAATVTEEPSKEDKLKAAYLLNFTRFITWPDNDTEQKTSIRICLQDHTPFLGFLKNLLADKVSSGYKSKVEVHQLSATAQCDLTYLHYPRLEIDPDISYGLIVLASEDMQEAGAAIVFYISDRKLRFEIDVDRVAEEGAVFSSELLKLARIK